MRDRRGPPGPRSRSRHRAVAQPHRHLDRRMVQPPTGPSTTRLAHRRDPTGSEVVPSDRTGFAALCVSDVDHHQLHQRGTARTSEKRKPTFTPIQPDRFPERLRRLGFGDCSIDTTDDHFRFLPEHPTRPSRSEVALYVTEATLGGRAPLTTNVRSVGAPDSAFRASPGRVERCPERADRPEAAGSTERRPGGNAPLAEEPRILLHRTRRSSAHTPLKEQAALHPMSENANRIIPRS
jgi:hypothetical protein